MLNKQIIHIQSYKRIVPMIYAYTTPGVTYHEGWTKIGYTERDVQKRIAEQTHTAGIKINLLWQDNAMYKDGSGKYFTDHQFHQYLEKKDVKREQGTEWFEIDGPKSRSYFDKFSMKLEEDEKYKGSTYTLRKEQEEAVTKTLAYLSSHHGKGKFLWNAKPRFGKTLATYDLLRRMKAKKVLIVTNRPSIANSWNDDFQKFIAWQTSYQFISDSESLKKQDGVKTREEYIDFLVKHNIEAGEEQFIAFESLQGLKGAVYFGGKFDKLQWIAETKWDVLVIDESHEGVDTNKTDRAFKNIKRDFTLYLSGTPFKALANNQFSEEQIYNWSYADEQKCKENWQSDDYNPYAPLPKLLMFTYQMSPIIRDTLQKGVDLGDEEGIVDYAFDLNEFFRVENGKFVYKNDVIKFLHALSTQEKYPFSTPELRQELSHTLWLFNRVDSVKAMANLLQEDDVFKEYKVILAAGDGRLDEESSIIDSYTKVKQAIEDSYQQENSYHKTITLSVGQLTTGVTIPEWSGVLMLSNMKSPAQYMQAAFRAQNPFAYTKYDGTRYRKENAYVFDFDPARTLVIFDEFANNLKANMASGHGSGEERKENIKELLNFFPVIGEDENGKMIPLDAAQVLTIPRKLKSKEVVKRGFMSNFLFQNISNIFSAPSVVKDILEHITPIKENSGKNTSNLENINDINVSENGEVEIPTEQVIGQTQDIFGDKIYHTMSIDVESILSDIGSSTAIKEKFEDITNALKYTIKNNVITTAKEEYKLKNSEMNRLEKYVNKDIDDKFEKVKQDFEQQKRSVNIEHKKAIEQASQNQQTAEELQQIDQSYQQKLEEITDALRQEVLREADEIINNKPQEVVEQLEKQKAEKEKNTVEEEVRNRLRGFARTIPSFIMAYGTRDMTLQNFDTYTEDDVFKEVTSITEEQFRFLRDGGEYIEEETGEIRCFGGHLFDEVVFNDSIQEFLDKKEELANYFEESHNEDIFDYIPPQKTNQIFTPQNIVKRMVDMLEENDPDIFSNPNKTFVDIYMKSGLYITEIIKRLYRNKKMKQLYPNDTERIQHILKNQVYGLAPTRIIYLIATNYILGFDDMLNRDIYNFREKDTTDAAKNGTLQQLIDDIFW